MFGNLAIASMLGLALGSAVPTTVPATMKAVHVNTTKGCGAPDFACVTIETVKTPTPGLGEVLVRVASSSVNPSDLDVERSIGGLFGVFGIDFAGTVVATGPGVAHLKIGDNVWGCSKGTYAEYALAFEAITATSPANIPMDVAGTIPEVGMTSMEALVKMGAPWPKALNKTVVITSGTGGTGFIAIQLAKAFGAGHVITSTSGATNIAFAKSLGADQVFDYKEVDIFDALTNNSVDFVFDNYGAKGSADKAMRSMRLPGAIYELLPGGEDGQLSKHPRPGVTQISFGEMEPNKKNLEALSSMFDAGVLKPHIDSTFALVDTHAAFARSATGETVGKIAITAQ